MRETRLVSQARLNGVRTCRYATPRTMLEFMYLIMALGKVIGLRMNFDSSPMRTFGLGGVASSQEVLVKTARLIDQDGGVTPSAPRACVPFGKLFFAPYTLDSKVQQSYQTC